VRIGVARPSAKYQPQLTKGDNHPVGQYRREKGLIPKHGTAFKSVQAHLAVFMQPASSFRETCATTKYKGMFKEFRIAGT
jgi:hypothetical protein